MIDESAQQHNETWAIDFVYDQLATGRKIRVLTIVDTFSRFSPAVDPRFNYRSEDVVLTLERICKSVGYPETIRVDQGSEFISRDLNLWAKLFKGSSEQSSLELSAGVLSEGCRADFSRPCKPADNAFIEPFNGKSGRNV